MIALTLLHCKGGKDSVFVVYLEERERERDAFMKNGSNFVSHSVSILAQAQEAILSNGYKRISFFIFSYPIKYGQHLGKWTFFMKFSFNDKI